MAKFQKGKSGNPAGKPKGAKDKRTELRALLYPHKEKLVQKAVDLALTGDTTALRMCLDRLVAPLKARDGAVTFSIDGGTGIADQGRDVVTALTKGELTPDEAASIMSVLSAQARIIETNELEKRVTELEAKTGAAPERKPRGN